MAKWPKTVWIMKPKDKYVNVLATEVDISQGFVIDHAVTATNTDDNEPGWEKRLYMFYDKPYEYDISNCDPLDLVRLGIKIQAKIED